MSRHLGKDSTPASVFISELLIHFWFSDPWSESFSAASQLLHCWDVWLMLQYNLISNIVQKHKNNNSCQNSNSRQSHKSLAGRYRTSRNIEKQSHLSINNTPNGSQRKKHNVFFLVPFKDFLRNSITQTNTQFHEKFCRHQIQKWTNFYWVCPLYESVDPIHKTTLNDLLGQTESIWWIKINPFL